MRKIKLTYFDLKGLALPIRLCMYINNIEFEDKRVSHDVFKEIEDGLPFNQLPILQADDRILCQSNSILFYLSERSGMKCDDAYDQAFLVQLLECLADVPESLRNSIMETNKNEKIAMRETLSSNELPKMLVALDSMVQKTIDEEGHLMGNKLTIADLKLFGIIDHFKSGILEGIPTNIADKYTNLIKSYECVKKHPKVAEWIEKCET